MVYIQCPHVPRTETEELWAWLPQKLFSLSHQCHTDAFSPLRVWDLKLAQGSTTQRRCSHFQQRVAISCIWFGWRAKKKKRGKERAKKGSCHSCRYRLTGLVLTRESERDARVPHLKMVCSKNHYNIFSPPTLKKRRPTFLAQPAQELFWQISWWLDLLFCSIIHGDKHEDFLFSVHKWGNYLSNSTPSIFAPENKA